VEANLISIEPLWTVDFQASTGTGQFEFGTIDSSKYTGNIAYGAISSNTGLWTVEIQGIGAGYDDRAYKPLKFQVVFDTGTGGGSISREIYIGARYQVPNGMTPGIITCTHAPIPFQTLSSNYRTATRSVFPPLVCLTRPAIMVCV
jgi:hypothetical protein